MSAKLPEVLVSAESLIQQNNFSHLSGAQVGSINGKNKSRDTAT